MGWGTFAAGQALRWARGASRVADSGPGFEEFLYWLNRKFLESYIRRVLRRTVILHPSIWNSVDLDYWEESITTRAARDWRILVGIQAVIVTIGVLTFWPLLFLYIPGFWYFGKSRSINSFAAEINKEFASEGFDVVKLAAEIPALLSDELLAEEQQAEAQRIRQAEADYKKKFGRSKPSS